MPRECTSQAMYALQVDDFLRDCVSGSKQAKWAACAILFTDKDRTAHLTKSLAHQFEGRLAFGEVGKANKELATKYNITGYEFHLTVLTRTRQANI